MATPRFKPVVDERQGIIPDPEKVEFFLLSGKERLSYLVNERPPFYIDHGDERGSDSEWEDYPDLSGPTIQVRSLRRRRGIQKKDRSRYEEARDPNNEPQIKRNQRVEVVNGSSGDEWGRDHWKEYFRETYVHPCQGGESRHVIHFKKLLVMLNFLQ